MKFSAISAACPLGLIAATVDTKPPPALLTSTSSVRPLALELGHPRVDGVGVAHVEHGGGCPPTEGLDLGDGARELVPEPVADRHVRAEARQRERGRPADAPGRAGDQRAAAGQQDRVGRGGEGLGIGRCRGAHGRRRYPPDADGPGPEPGSVAVIGAVRGRRERSCSPRVGYWVTATAVTMPNMPSSRSAWLRMWQCQTQAPVCAAWNSTVKRSPGPTVTVSAQYG